MKLRTLPMRAVWAEDVKYNQTHSYSTIIVTNSSCYVRTILPTIN